MVSSCWWPSRTPSAEEIFSARQLPRACFINSPAQRGLRRLKNSLIEGTKWEDVVVELKMKRGWNPMGKNGNKKPTLGQKKENAFGQQATHLLIHPECVIFVARKVMGQEGERKKQ
jgi:hypothetical protein